MTKDETRQQLLGEVAALRQRLAELEGAEAERSRAESLRDAMLEALRQSEDKFKSVFDHSIVGKSITLPSGEISVNKAFCEMLGYTAEELQNTRWQDITHPDDIELTQIVVDSLLFGKEESQRFVKRYLHKRGAVVWADVSTSMRRDKEGKPLYFMTTVSDITERVRAEEALERNLHAMTLLRDASEAFIQEDDMQVLLDKAVETAILLAGTDRGNIQLFDPQSGHLVIQAQRGFPQRWLDFWCEVSPGEGACGTAEQRGERVVVEDFSCSPIFVGKPALEIQLAADVHAVVSTPLVGSRGQFVGMMSVHFNQPHRPEERVLQQLDILARLVADSVLRKQADEALRKSEESYRAVVELQTELIDRWRPDGTLTFVNDAYCRYYGRPREELIGRKWMEVVAGEDQERVKEYVGRLTTRLSSANTTTTEEHREIGVDGSIRWQQWTDRALFDEQGHLVEFQSVGHDITERKQAEEAHRAQFERASRHDRALVHLATKGIPLAGDFGEAARVITQAAGEATGVERVSVWLLHDDGRQLACVDLYELGTGRHSSGVTLDASRHPRYFEALSASRVVDAHDARDDPRTSEFRDDYLAPLDITSMLDATIRDAGQVVGVLCFEHVGQEPRIWQADELAFAREVADQAALAFLDAERKRAAAALEQSEEQYRSLVETSGAGVVSIDLQGKLTFVNQGACGLFGYSKEELLGRSFADFLYPEEAGQLLELFQSALQNPDARPQLEFRIKRKDGRMAYGYTVPTLNWRADQIVGANAIIHDISDRKQAEDALWESEQRLKEAQAMGRLGHWEFDVDHQSIAWSDQVYELYERDPALGPPTGEEEAAYYSPEQVQVLREYARHAIETGERFEYDLQARLPSGKIAFLSATMHPIRDEHGRVVRLRGTVQDITERKRADKEIHQRNQDLALLNSINAAVNRGETLAAIVELISEETQRVFDSMGTTLYLLDENRDRLVMQNLALPPKMAAQIERLMGLSIPLIEHDLGAASLFRQVLESRQGRLITDSAQLQEFVGLYVDSSPFSERVRARLKKLIPALVKLLGQKSLVIVPLVSGDEVIGTLEMGSRGMFTEDDLHRFESVAGQLTAAIQRKRAEEALEEAEERYRSLVEQIPAVIYTDSAEQVGQTLYISPQLKAITGYAPEEWMADNDLWLKIMHPDERERVLAENIRAYESGEPFRAEYRVLTPEGRVVWIRDEAILNRDPAGRPLFWQGILLDITERKRAEELINTRLKLTEFAVSHSLEEVLQETLDQIGALTDSPIGFYHFVESDQKTLSLQAWSTRTLQEFCQAEGEGLHYPIDQAGVWVDCVHAKKPVIHNDYASLPHRKGMPEGHGQVIRELVVPILREGNVVAILGVGNKPAEYTEADANLVAFFADVAWEIAERKRAEEELRRLKEFNEDIVQTMAEGIVVEDAEGFLTFVNPALATLLGYEPGELAGQHWTCIVPPDQEPIVRAADERRALGQIDHYELELLHKDGARLPVLVSASPGFEQGRFAGALAVFTDITKRKRHERLLLALNQAALAMEAALRPEEIFTAAAEEFKKLGLFCVVFLMDESRTRLLPRYLSHGSEAVEAAEKLVGLKAQEFSIPIETVDVFREVVRERKSLFIEDAEEGARQILPKPLKRFAGQIVKILKAPRYIPVPLVVEDEVIGVLSVESGDLTEVDVPAITAFAHQMAAAWRKAQLLEQAQQEISVRLQAEEELRRYTERLRSLRAIDGAVLGAWSAEEIARIALRRLRQLVPCLGAGIGLFDFEAQEATLFALDPDSDIGLEKGMRFPFDGLAEVELLRQGKVLVEEDLLTLLQPPAIVQALQAAGLRSYVGVPLIAAGKLIGAMGLGATTPAAFAPEHVEIASEVADQVAVALHQAGLRAALESEQQKLEALVEYLPEGIVLLDGSGRILLANPTACAYLPLLTDADHPATGCTGEVLTHLVGCSLDEILSPLPGGKWHELELAGPPHRFFQAVARSVRLASDVTCWALVIQEVTEQRQAQEHTEQQERLAAVGQLAGGIAHDFNNLLSAIMLHAQLSLSKPGLPSEAAQSLGIIAGESRRAAELVQQILDFSRRSSIETRAVDLKPFLKEAVRMLERTIPERISIVLDVLPDEYLVRADPTRIQQILMNLVVNARDAMSEGGVLRIGLSRLEVGPGEQPPVVGMESGEWVCLSVSDTGEGIKPGVLPHIFEPFFTTKEPGRGTGLGLAQVYGIVTQHGGQVGVETALGKGTTFRVYLPACHAEEEPAREEEVAAAPEGKGETILLVEDNKRLLRAAQMMLESLGYRVLTAANGREALERYKTAEGVELVLTDVVMPEMGAGELVRALRELTPEVKVLATSGYVLAEEIEALKTAGVLEVIPKPLEVDVLARVIRQVLDVD